MKTAHPETNRKLAALKSFFHRPLSHAILISGAGVFMAALSWRGWPDAQVDYGNQLYFPWRISLGEVLYRDLFYIYGPLSQYTHGLLFKLFGVDFMVIAWFNILLILLFTLLIYRLFTYLADAATGMLCALTFVTVFAFAQYVGIGNFNFVSSYRHELAHGALLSILAMALFNLFCRNQKTVYLTGSGLSFGLAFLTKSEVFTALFIVMAPTALLIMIRDERFRNQRASLLAVFSGGALFPPVLFGLYLSFQMPFTDVINTVLLPWKLTLIPEVRLSPFYQLVMGTDKLIPNLLLMIQYGLSLAFIFLSLLGINHATRNLKVNQTFLSASLFTISLAAFYILFDWPLLLDAARGLPLLAGSLLLIELWRLMRSWNTQNKDRHLLQFMLTLFAMVLLGKMILFARLGHYGFVLSLPITLLLVKVLFYDGNRWALNLSKTNAAYRSLSLALITGFIAGHVYISYVHYSKKSFALGDEKEYIYDYHPGVTPRGLLLQMSIDVIKDSTQESETITAFPNSATFNYLARRRNSIKYDNFTPTEQIIFGEQALIDALRTHPPDYILFTSHDLSSFGAKTFGKDYAIRVFEWIRKNYTAGRIIGEDPFSEPKGFGIQFWSRKRT